ncbi:hypothetical protein Leryth_021744 [Lithospermum erythrorhizon]|nr:hypothetical protein Leryth_021744 [Lithospermum erythrorhizon]
MGESNGSEQNWGSDYGSTDMICDTCGNQIYRGRKFDCRKEDVGREQILRRVDSIVDAYKI